LLCVTETVSREEIDRTAEAFSRATGSALVAESAGASAELAGRRMPGASRDS
jgi:hypothetical protein